MPYASNSEVPSYVPSGKKSQWREVWNSAYAAAIKEGKSKEKAEESAFAQANGVAGPKSKKFEEGDVMESMTVKSLSNNEVQIFCPLVKVDAAKREVWGVVTAESPDKDGEICDYATTVPYYKDVVSEMSKATDGANIFPLRAMHGLIAAGKGIDIEFRKEAKEIYMGFKVVDDVEWKKVEENVYTGFSQGGRYIKKWKDGDYMRYTAKPGEVSLVDMPCLTRAHFDYIKSDGSVEIRKFSSTPQLPTGNEEISERPSGIVEIDKNTQCACSCANCKAGDCSACTAGEKCGCGKTVKVNKTDAGKAVKYLVTEKDGTTHLPYTNEDGKPNHRLMGAAWAALFSPGGHRGNKYEGPNKETAKKKLKQLYAREGLDTPAEKAEVFDNMIKGVLIDVIQGRAFGQLNKSGMYTVSNFARITEDLKYLILEMEYELDFEGDESPVTDNMKELYSNLLDHLMDYCSEQVEEEREKMHEKAYV